MLSLLPRPVLSGLAVLTPLALVLASPPDATTFPFKGYQSQNLIQHSPNTPTKTVVLDMDGDFRKDAVVLSAGNLHMSWAVGSFMSADTIPNIGVVRDLAVLPGLNTGDPERLITIGADGALAWSYSSATGLFSSINLNLPNWTLAGRVLACNVDAGQTDNDLVAVAVDNATIGIVSNVGVVSTDPNLAQSIWPTLLSADGTGTVQPVLDFAVGNLLDGSTNRDELVLLRANDLRVFELTDGAISLPINTISEGSIAVLKNEAASAGFEELAICGKDNVTGDHWISTAYADSTVLALSPIYLTNFGDVVGLSAGDIIGATMEEDDIDEIVVLLPTTSSLVVFQGTLIDGHIEYRGDQEVMPMGSGVLDTFSQHSPLIADVDNDEVMDLIHVTTYGPRTHTVVFHGERSGTIASTPPGTYVAPGRITLLTEDDNILDAAGDPIQQYHPSVEVSSDEEFFNVKLTVDMPVMKSGLPGLEIVTWVLREGDAGIETNALFRTYIGSPAWDTGAVEYRFTTDQSWSGGSYPTTDGAHGSAGMTYANPVGDPSLVLPVYSEAAAPSIGALHHPNFSLSPDIFFFEFRAVAVDPLDNTDVKDAGTSIFIAHFNMSGDWEGTTGYLGQNWPALLPEEGTHAPSLLDAMATDDKNMVEHFGLPHYGQNYEVREVDPIEVPIPWPVPPVGGPPTSANSGDHIDPPA